jgi:YidC/Oxa1 family membrane protein insertase
VDKRSALALGLCFFIFIGWMWLQNKIWPPPKPLPPAKVAPVDPSKTPKPGPVAPAPAPAPAPTPGTPAPPAKPEPEAARYPEKPSITLRSQVLEVVLTNKGAGIERATIHFPKPTDTVKLLEPIDPRWPHMALRQVGGPDAIESLPWEIVEQKDDRVGFRYRLRDGVEVTKTFVLDPTAHTLQLTVMLDNKNPVPPGKDAPPEQELALEFLAVNGIDPDSLYRFEQYLMGVDRYDKTLRMKSFAEIQKGEAKLLEAERLPEGKEREDELKSIHEKYFRVEGGRKEWFGVNNRFFVAAVMPDGPTLDVLDQGYYEFRGLPPDVAKRNDGHQNITASARTQPFKVGTARKVYQLTVYVGPMQKDALKVVPGLDDLGGYRGGCFLAFVVKPAAAIILEMLHFTSGLVHNMGLGIIVTTLLIRLCLFPLSLKSQRNAMQMQLLSPKIKALKERYKDDQQKYGVEQMRLFKENGVNPVAGCLPLFIQMPIFIGMYSVFEMSIDLRHAHFFGWIKDLAEPDRLLGPWHPFAIPLLITELKIDALNLLPILMTVTWFLQAYFTPRSPDPQMAQQQKMMMWMPIVFGLTCYGLASGLSLYFLSNSLLSMGEQRIIKRYILKIGPDGKPLAPAVPGEAKT